MLLILPRAAMASGTHQPFFSRNQSPFIQIYGLPSAEGGTTLPGRSLETRLVLNIANNFTGSTASSESIILDGETRRATLVLRYGLRDNLEIGLDLPYIDHGGGIFDGLISDWHDLFAFPQGGRDQVAEGRLLYRYTEGGAALVSVDEAGSGIGDLLLSMAVPLWQGQKARRQLALRTAVKVPTGSASGLRGSGSTDFSVRLNGEDRQTFAGWDIAWFGTAGVLLLSEGDVIPDRQRNTVGFGSLGFDWQPLAWLTLKAQLDGHTPFYDSELTELGDISMQLILGGTLTLPSDFYFDLAITEDVIVDTAPDVVLHVALRRRF